MRRARPARAHVREDTSCDIFIPCCAFAISTPRSTSIATSSASRKCAAATTRRTATPSCSWPRPHDEASLGDSKRKGRDAPLVELTYNWDSEDYGEARYFGHLAYEVDDIYATCERLMQAGVTINRPPRDGTMAFVRSPDRHSIELLQKGAALPPKSPGNRCRTPATGRRGTAPARPQRRPASLLRPLLARPGKRLYMSPRFARPSSSGPGRRPFTAVTWVRVP